MGMRSSGPRLLVGHDVGHCILSVVTGIDCGRLQSVLCCVDNISSSPEFKLVPNRIENHVISRVLPGRPTGRCCRSKHRASRSVGCTQATAPFIDVSLFHAFTNAAIMKLDPVHPRRPSASACPCPPSLYAAELYHANRLCPPDCCLHCRGDGILCRSAR